MALPPLIATPTGLAAEGRQGDLQDSKMVLAKDDEVSLLWADQISVLAKHVSHVVGMRADTDSLIFLDQASWICSFHAKAKPPGYFRHFFLPTDWFAGRRELLCLLVEQELVLAKGGDSIVARNWSEFAEKVEI